MLQLIRQNSIVTCSLIDGAQNFIVMCSLIDGAHGYIIWNHDSEIFLTALCLLNRILINQRNISMEMDYQSKFVPERCACVLFMILSMNDRET